MMSTLVSSGAGVVTMTSTFAALGTAPVRVVILKLLQELDALAGIALLGIGVPVGGDFELGDMKKWGEASGSLVRSNCSGFASAACAGVVGGSLRVNHVSRSWIC